jgi:hypothetical protein
MLLSKPFAQPTERGMSIFLIDKGLPLYYWLKIRIGKKGIFEKGLLAFGREQVCKPW